MPLLGRAVSPVLRPCVSRLWMADHYEPGSHRQERVLPTGEASLIIDLSNGAAVLSGARSEPLVIDVAAQYFVAGVQFTPGGAFPFFDVPQHELTHQVLPLDALWSSLASALRDRVLAASPPEARLDALEQALLARLRSGRALHPAVRYALQRLAGPSALPVGDVVGRVGLSHRRFLDLFQAEVGLTPKRFARVRRFQRVLGQMRRGAEVRWADVAVACGYYDQAHFIREFVAFSGVNPTRYRAAGGVHPNHVPL